MEAPSSPLPTQERLTQRQVHGRRSLYGRSGRPLTSVPFLLPPRQYTKFQPESVLTRRLRLLTHLHDVVVDLYAGALDDAEVSLKVAPADVVVRLSVVGGPVEEDARTSVVLHHVVVDHRTA